MRLSWSFTLSVLIHASLTLVYCLGLLTVSGRHAVSQEVEFKPRWDGVAKPKRPKQNVEPKGASSSSEAPALYSFHRYAGQLRQICDLLERDHRRERVGQVAFDEIRAGMECKSCKAFLREIVEQCHYRKKPVVRQTVTPAPAMENDATPSTDAATPTPAASASVPQAARHPLTETLDRTSSFSSELYERDAGEGAIFESVRFFADVLMKQEDLSPAEREYYGIFTAYLLSAWDGRPNSPLEGQAPSRQDVRALFE